MATTKWVIDPSHSEIQFKVKHLVISTVTGQFNTFEGSVEAESEDFQDAQIAFDADVNSISTNNEQRDGHLKSDDFFNAEAYPKLTFKSTEFKKINEEKYHLKGHLTIRDVTKEIVLDASYGGVMVDPWGNTKAGFELNGVINRKEFGLKWNALTEAGGAVVAEDVRLHVNVEIAKQ